MKYAPLLIKMKIFAFIEQCPEPIIRTRILKAADQVFIDEETGDKYKFTWSTISTWYYRYKKTGSVSMMQKARKDKGLYRKIQPQELAECIDIALKHIPRHTSNRSIKTVIYHWLLENNYFNRSQLSPSIYYKIIRENDLLKPENYHKLRQSFSLPYANDLWQGDTMHGPYVKDLKGKSRKSYLIALLDDCSRIIVHACFYHTESVQELTHTLKMGIYCRGIPRMLYFDNGPIYKSKTVIDACARLDIKLTHTPVRDGAAKGKVERFFNTVRNQFFKTHGAFKNIDHLNDLFKQWLLQYNERHHSGIQMAPESRFAIDIKRVRYLANNEFNDELFYLEALRCVTKTNTFSLHGKTFECPADLRERKIEVRYESKDSPKVIVYYKQKRVGKANLLDLHLNARIKRETKKNPSNLTQRKETK